MCAAIVLAGLAAGCELVAGIQDKYLTSPDASGVGVSPLETSLPSGDDSTDGGFVRSEASAQTPDATDTPQPTDAPMASDAPLDAGIPALIDAADAGDPSRTAPDAGTTDPSAPCSEQPPFLFCDDFDTETTVGQSWTWMLSSIDGGSEAFDTAAYTSSPRSALIVAPSTAPPNNELFGLDVGSLTSQVRVAFDLRIDMESLTNLPETTIAQVLGGSTIELDYLVRPNQGALLNALLTRDAGGVSISLPAPPLRTWTRLVIVYDVSAGITVYEDGVQIGASAAAASGPPNETKVQLGMVYQLGAGSATLQTEMDNIVVRGQ